MELMHKSNGAWWDLLWGRDMLPAPEIDAFHPWCKNALHSYKIDVLIVIGDRFLFSNNVYGHDFPGEIFHVLKEKEGKNYGGYCTRPLVLEAWDKLEIKLLSLFNLQQSYNHANIIIVGVMLILWQIEGNFKRS